MVTLLDCERHLIRYINLPFGTRLVCWARKPALVAERVTVPAVGAPMVEPAAAARYELDRPHPR